MLGVIGAIELKLLLPLVLCWFLVVLLTGYVGLATMLSAAVLLLAVRVLEPGNGPLLTFCAAMTAFIVYTHRANIARMLAGQENRARKLWLFRSRAA
jgi:glycerol-3-phosphate acyltransferase PlsY